MRALEALSDDTLAILAEIVSTPGEGYSLERAPAVVSWLGDEVAHEQARREGRIEPEPRLPAFTSAELEEGAAELIALHHLQASFVPAWVRHQHGRELSVAGQRQRAELAALFEHVAEAFIGLVRSEAEAVH